MPSVLQKIITAYMGLIDAVSEINIKVQNNEDIMVTSDEIRQVINLFNTALDAQAGSAVALAQLSGQLSALQANIADLNDPTLEADLQAVLAKAAASNAPTGAVDPLPEPPPVEAPANPNA